MLIELLIVILVLGGILSTRRRGRKAVQGIIEKYSGSNEDVVAARERLSLEAKRVFEEIGYDSEGKYPDIEEDAEYDENSMKDRI